MPSLRCAQDEGLIPLNLKFRFLGQPKPYHPNRLLARFQSWFRFLMFTQRLLASAKSWHSEEGFDVAQHVTYTTWRVASPLWRLGIPFIWGPLSGTELFPASCHSTLSFSSLCFEIIRSIQSFLARKSSAIRACAQSAFCIPVPHQQAQSFIQNLRGSKSGVPICHNFFFPETRMRALHTTRPTTSALQPLRAFAAGNLEGRKGVAIALQAIFLAKKAGVRVEYQVTSRGPELTHLQRLSKRLQLTDQVILGVRFDATDFSAALGTFDIVLLPSLRDGAGLSIMEAMLAGCVPIVADWCGPAEFVTPECGFKIPISNPQIMATQISKVLISLYHNRQRVRDLGAAARRYIEVAYSETRFIADMNSIYQSATQ